MATPSSKTADRHIYLQFRSSYEAKPAIEAGVELLVLDDGWFGKRDDASCRVNSAAVYELGQVHPCVPRTQLHWALGQVCQCSEVKDSKGVFAHYAICMRHRRVSRCQGDWVPDPRKLPRGLKGLAEAGGMCDQRITGVNKNSTDRTSMQWD